jgi:hypothetical protein
MAQRREQSVVEARRKFRPASASLRAKAPKRIAGAPPLQTRLLRTAKSRCSERTSSPVKLFPRMSVFSISTRDWAPDFPSALTVLPATFKAVSCEFDAPLTESEQFCRKTSLAIADNRASSGSVLNPETSRPR